MKRRVVITGLGIVSPIGNGKDNYWQALQSGRSGVTEITSFDASAYTSRIAGVVQNFDLTPYMSKKDIKRSDRFTQFAVVAARMAFEDSGLDSATMDPYRAGSIIGSGIGGIHTIEKEHQVLIKDGPSRVSPFFIPMIIVNMASGMAGINLGLKGPNSCSVTACASGNHCIGEALRIIQHGYAEIMFAGGSEAAISPMGIGGFCAARALSTRNDDPKKASRPFDAQRNGFVMAEGSGIILLEEYEHAKQRGAEIYAEVIGYGMSCDAYHMTAPNPNGEGAIRCMQETLKDASINPEDVAYINAHGTSTMLNDAMETKAIKAVFGERAKKIAISSTKSMTGHMLGAAGGAELAATVLSLSNNLVAPTINYEYPDPNCDLDYVPNKAREVEIDIAISNSFGFGGHNATIAIKKI
ncbi:MAG: beta-ketoacyl-ACP synthase II [Candidatus Orphnella occulta]|nr:beta-ketoacyl-ACP synthase II [Candidatus Orphnella occulta]